MQAATGKTLPRRLAPFGLRGAAAGIHYGRLGWRPAQCEDAGGRQWSGFSATVAPEDA